MSKEMEVLEALRCALFNADNIKEGGLLFVEVVKLQIQEAIDLLEKP